MRSINDNNPYFKQIVRAVLDKKGKRFDTCELCGKPLTKKTAQVHHAKYDGATINDLKVVCASCNLQSENKNLN